MNFLVLIPAIIVAVPAVIMANNVVQVRRWRRVPGVVLSTHLTRMASPRSTARSYRPVIQYRYTVNGTDHRGDVYQHGMQSGGHQAWAQRILDRYPPGRAITVLHHPTHVDRACITASFGFFGWVLAALALLLLGLALSL